MRQDGRKADLAAIHLGAKQLRWSREEYEDIMATVCAGIRSAGKLDHTGRKRFMAHIQQCIRASGIRPSPSAHTQDKPLTGAQRLMWSLWMRLVDAGLAEHRTMAALNAFCERQTEVRHIQWLNKRQQDLLIESLKAWLARAAVAVPSPTVEGGSSGNGSTGTQ